MPFGTYDTPKPEPTPTFLQFVRTISKGVEGKTKFTVDIIWLPGKFDNVTLQTHAFRYQCSPSHPLYNEMREYVQSFESTNSSPRLEIVIASIEERKITLQENPKFKGCWEKLGSNAFRFKGD